MEDYKSVTISDIYSFINSNDEESKKILASLKKVFIEGWVRTNRDNGSIGFIAINDGTCFKNAQLVYFGDMKDENGHEISHANTGAAIGVKGELVLTPEMKQPFEIRVEEYTLIGDVDPAYPLQKKHHSMP